MLRLPKPHSLMTLTLAMQNICLSFLSLRWASCQQQADAYQTSQESGRGWAPMHEFSEDDKQHLSKNMLVISDEWNMDEDVAC